MPGDARDVVVMTDVGRAVEELRRSVAEPDDHLFMAGVVSIRLADLMVLKPAGVSYDNLSADSIVITDLSGKVVYGVLPPSAGGDAHAYVYRSMPEVRGVVNTRSTLSLAAAARGEPIPHLRAEGQIPVGPVRSEGIGRGIVDTLRASESAGVLMRGYGLFTVGPNAAEAFKAAASLEQVIRTLHIGRHLGTAEPLDPQDVEWLRARDRITGARP